MALDLLRSVHFWLSEIVTDRNVAKYFKIFTKDIYFNQHFVGRTLANIIPEMEELMRLVSVSRLLPNKPMEGKSWDNIFTWIDLAACDYLMVINNEYVSVELADAMELPITNTPARLNTQCLQIAERRVLAWLNKYP